jgi:hypothetical protein
MRYIILIAIFINVLTLACKSKRNGMEKIKFDTRVDIRFGTRFYSICHNKKGVGYVIRGKGANDRQPFTISSSDTSRFFQLKKSIDIYNILNKMTAKHFDGSSNPTDAPRVEIYYNNNKIYDGFRWNSDFMDLMILYSPELPKEYNPFRGKQFEF